MVILPYLDIKKEPRRFGRGSRASAVSVALMGGEALCVRIQLGWGLLVLVSPDSRL